MKPKIILCLALVLSGGLFGCSSIGHHSADSKQSRPDLYLHLYASSVDYPEPPHLILSAPIHLSSDFDIPMDDNQRLKGRIEPRNGKFFVYFKGRLCSGTNVFDDEVELEKIYEPGPQPYDVKAPFICQPMFVLSLNSNPKSFLKRQAAAEKKQWHLENPLTARQLAEVKRRFHFMRAGMTKSEVFAMLGLSRYRNRLLPGSAYRSNDWNRESYQLVNRERLVLLLLFEYTGNKTDRIVVQADGKFLWPRLDPADYKKNRAVIQVQLGSEIWSKEDGYPFQTANPR
jgi:hypothetical protein